MRRTAFVVGVIGLVNCERKAVEPRFDGPLILRYGDCASTSVAWVSGPRPAPFTPAQAEDGWVPEEQVAAAEPVPAPPPPVAAPGDGSNAALTRQQALEAARASGIIGSTTLQQGGAFASLTGTADIGEPVLDEGGLLGNEPGEMSGGGFGFGRIGSGPQNGGPSWGSIGAGYGAIGHGSGSGYGIRRDSNRVSIGQATAQGHLDKEIIRRYIRRNINKISYCYEKQLLVNATLAGTVTAKFFITPNGDVATSQATGVDAEVSSCVARVIKAIEFPKPKGGSVQVVYPFTFRQADSAAATPPAQASDAGAGSAEVAVADAGAGSASGSTPLARASKRHLFRAASGANTYQPGAANPLRAEDKALTECFRKAPLHYGTAVIEIAYDHSGRAAGVTLHGVDDPRVITCVAPVVRRLIRLSPTTTNERCALTFGEMPVAALPALDITADALTLGGKTLGETRAVNGGDAHATSIAAVSAAITTRVDSLTAISKEVVTNAGPLVVRPVDVTPMKVVTRVLSSILVAGDDFVLAAQAGPGWELVNPLALPVVPVPFGTGGMWSHVKGGIRGPGSDKRSAVSMLIAPDRIWIGASDSTDSVELKRDASAAARVTEELAKRRKPTTKLEIAADDAITYRDFVTVVKAAIAAGFVDWQLADPASLAARPQN